MGFFTASLAYNKRLQTTTSATCSRDVGAVPEAWEKSQKIGVKCWKWYPTPLKKIGFFWGKLFTKWGITQLLQISNIFFLSLPVITKVASDLVKTCSFSRITLRCGFFFVTNFYYLCYMEIEIGLTNGPLLGFSLNYADEEYPYDEMVFYFLFAHITFKWNM